MEQEIRFCLSADGTRIAYATSGAGRPLVRVSNWLTHLNLDRQSPVWAHWLESLSQGQTLIRYDARGNGLSDRLVKEFSIDVWVRDLEAVVEAQKLERFPLLGFCQGGAVAIAYAVRHPERVSRLILYDSYAQGAYTAGMEPKLKQQAEVLEGMIEVGWGQQAAAFRQVFANLLVPGASKEQEAWFAELQRRTVSTETAVRMWRAFHTIDVRHLATQVTVPTLVFHVRGDAMVPFESGRQLASLIPGARFVPLEGKNHILLQEDPGWPRFLAQLRHFLGTEAPVSTEKQRTISTLTPREREVLELIAQGCSNADIAQRLVIAPKTVRNHVTRIYGKLEADSRAQAVVLAREAGLGHGDSLS